MNFKRNGLGRHNGTRNGIASLVGTSEARLRALENAGTLTSWDKLEADDYLEVAALLVAARQSGMPMQRIKRAVFAIRRAVDWDDLDKKQKAAFAEMARQFESGEWGKTSMTRAEWFAKHNAEPEEK